MYINIDWLPPTAAKFKPTAVLVAHFDVPLRHWTFFDNCRWTYCPEAQNGSPGYIYTRYDLMVYWMNNMTNLELLFIAMVP